MTKKTEKLILSIFDYCVMLLIQAQKQGILALEEHRYEKCLTDTGEVILTRKVDKFLYWMLVFMLDGGYTFEGNQKLLKKLSKYSSRRTKLALNVASICIEGIYKGISSEQLLCNVCTYADIENTQNFWDVREKQEKFYSRNYEDSHLSDEDKKRIEALDIFFKMKEEECNRILNKKYKEICQLKLKVPELTEETATVYLDYKPKGCKQDYTLYGSSIPEKRLFMVRGYDEPHFIGSIQVCHSTWQFYMNYLHMFHAQTLINKKADDIKNQLEKYLTIKTEITLTREE